MSDDTVDDIDTIPAPPPSDVDVGARVVKNLLTESLAPMIKKQDAMMEILMNAMDTIMMCQSQYMTLSKRTEVAEAAIKVVRSDVDQNRQDINKLLVCLDMDTGGHA